MTLTHNNKKLGVAAAALAMLLLSGCASQTQELSSLQAEFRAKERALEDCQARAQGADERIQRAESRAEEFRLRAEELERRMARMEARMTSKG